MLKPRCTGPTRREVLRAGSLAPLGLSLLPLLGTAATPAPKSRAKSVIQIGRAHV